MGRLGWSLCLLLAVLPALSAQAQQNPGLERAGSLVESYFRTTSVNKRESLAKELAAQKLPFATIEKLVGTPVVPAARLSSGNRQVRFKFLDKVRTGEYTLWVPPGYDPRTRYPLILALHGTGGSGRNYVLNWKDGFGQDYLIAAPSAAPQYGLGGSTYAYRLALAVLADLQRIAHVDTDRVYAGGTSMGAHFAYQLGCHLADRFGAVVSHAGSGHRLVTYKYHSNFLNLGVYAINGRMDRAIPIQLARKGPAALQKLGYDVVFRELAVGHGHCYGEDAGVRDYLAKHRRSRYPKRVVKVVRRVGLESRAYWIRIDKLSRNKYPIGMRLKNRSGQVVEEFDLHREACSVEAQVTGNTVTVKTRHVSRLTLYLNDELVDLNKSVRIVVNGRTRHNKRFDRSIETLLEVCAERESRDLLFSVSVRLRP